MFVWILARIAAGARSAQLTQIFSSYTHFYSNPHTDTFGAREISITFGVKFCGSFIDNNPHYHIWIRHVILKNLIYPGESSGIARGRIKYEASGRLTAQVYIRTFSVMSK